MTLREITNNLDRNFLVELSGIEGKACVSIYMPAVKAGDQVRQNSIRFDNLVTQAQEKLERYGVDKRDIDALLLPLEELRTDDQFWINQTKGIAFFASPDECMILRLSFEPEEECIVDRRYFIRPLISLIKPNDKFYILSINQKTTDFLECNYHHWHEHPLPEELNSYPQFSKTYDFEDNLQFHYGGREGSGEITPSFHGHGGAGQENENLYLDEYLSKLANEVAKIIKSSDTPLYIAGSERLVGYFLKTARSRKLRPQVLIQKNTSELSKGELYEMALVNLTSQSQKRRDALEEFEQLKHSNAHATDSDTSSILTAAFEGRIKTLFVPDKNIYVWGNFDSESNELSMQEHDNQLGEEITNLAVTKCLQNGAEIFTVPIEAANKIKNFKPLAATYYW